MKGLKVLLSTAVLGVLMVSQVYSQDIERGKKLFNDSKFAGGKSGKSCATCHPGGKGLEGVADKKEFKLMGKTLKSLEEAVNLCIEMGLKGKPIDPKGKDMADLVAYLKSLKGKPSEAPKKKKVEGC